MSQSDPERLLEASMSGDPIARDRLAELIYGDLREVARGRLARERPGHTLQPTALANEAFVRLFGQDRADLQGKTHFLALAASSVRRVLLDHARRRSTLKREAPLQGHPIGESPVEEGDARAQVLDLNAALARLTDVEPRQARVVELRFFGGLTLEEVASELGVSRDTVKLDWRAAREWLSRQLKGGLSDP